MRVRLVVSKICDRNYKANQAYTVKMIKGIGCCPLCEQPAACHGKPVEYRALFWALHGSTGTSSLSIAQHMATGISDGMPPSDADDRSRCIRLFYLVPEWITRLNEMVKYDAPDKRQQGFVINSSGITADQNTWAKQIPLIVKEGGL
jgi:hypothetical protein